MRPQTLLAQATGITEAFGPNAGVDATQAAALRHALLELHRALIEHERHAYERLNGRQSGGAFLQLLAYDPAYRWLSPLSALIVALDEAEDMASDPAAVNAVAERVRELLRRDPDPAEPFSLRYSPLIDVSPEIALAHARSISAARPKARSKDAPSA